ncbi:MAG TPA: sugar phosphate isomerase/epimerase family protein [Tepidisphaeraceae bacterium]
MNRRDLMKLGAGASVAALLNLGVDTGRAQDVSSLPLRGHEPDLIGGTKRGFKKAVMWDMIKGGTTVLEKFQILKEAGFDGVEMNSPGGPPNDEIKRACEKTGLLVEGMVDSTHWKITLSHPNQSVRDQGLRDLEQALRDCKDLGGTSVLLVPGVVNANVTYDQCYERSQEQIRKALPLAQELGVRIAVEDVWNDFLLSPLEAARYVDEFNNPAAIGWHMDIGNIMAYGYPEQWIHILGRRILKLHVKEFSRSKMDKEGRWKGFDVKLGDGDINWKAVMTALDAISYHTWMCAEVPGGDLDALKDIARRMDGILAL